MMLWSNEMRGKKPNLHNVAEFPRGDEPQSVHYARADELKPDVLSDSAARIWDILAPQMVMLGRLKLHFVIAFAEYCHLTAKIAEMRKVLDAEEWTYATSGRNGTQYKSKPEVAQLNDDWRKWKSMQSCFGLTPTDERAVNHGGQGDIFDDFDTF